MQDRHRFTAPSPLSDEARAKLNDPLNFGDGYQRDSGVVKIIEPRLGKVVRAGLHTIPGVHIWEEEGLRVTARS